MAWGLCRQKRVLQSRKKVARTAAFQEAAKLKHHFAHQPERLGLTDYIVSFRGANKDQATCFSIQVKTIMMLGVKAAYPDEPRHGYGWTVRVRIGPNGDFNRITAEVDRLALMWAEKNGLVLED